ncbi:MAG TPA: hypothetical protein VKT80_15145, partial [Chloroflexota bacterium]|nr:hypothetical protein [Chloroflexota bacterium]
KYGDDPRWTTILAGTSASVAPSASSNDGMPKFENFSTGSTAGKAMLSTTAAYVPNPSSDTNLLICVEAELIAQQTAAGNDLMFGLSDVQDPSGGTGNQIRIRQRAGTNGNWWVSTISGGGAEGNFNDSGIAVATNTPARLRIEVYGSQTWPGQYQVRAYVNETLIGPLTASLPGGSDYFIFAGVPSSNGTPITAQVGPIFATWSRFKTQPLL